MKRVKTLTGKSDIPDEWQNHLQGGISGYAPLEYLILEASDVIVKENNIMAWNPTVKGAKSEDPALITPDGTLTVYYR